MSESEVKEEEIAENETAEVSASKSTLDFLPNEFLISHLFAMPARSLMMKIWSIHNWAQRQRVANVCLAKNCGA